MKIGIVDLDTSHPQAWIPLERALGHTVVGVWDGGSVHPASYVSRFAHQFHIRRVFSSLEEMAAKVDCAVIHGCDWDTHIAKARPFVAAGKAVLLDKPLAGNLADLQQLQAWVEQGARIWGGSSLRCCDEVRRFQAQSPDERGDPHIVFTGCGVDEFSYGIHAYSLLSGIMGPGAESVQHLAGGRQRTIRVNWPDGRLGIVVVGQAERWIPFYASIVTEKGVHQFIADNNQLYRALLEEALLYLAGRQPEPPAPFGQLCEPELIALAARRSWLEHDRLVHLNELGPDDAYDGTAFAREYRRSKYPTA